MRHYEKFRSAFGVSTLVAGVALSLGLGLVIWRSANGYRARRPFRSRVALLKSARQILDEWEESCLREVECSLRARLRRERAAEDGFLFGTNSEGVEQTWPFHGPLRSMAYAPGVDLSRWLRLWCVGHHLCATLPDDMVVLERLGYVIKFTAFRRLATMAEARYYSAAWRDATYGRSGDEKMQARKLRLPPWLVGCRPFWIVPVPVPEARRFLCLPLSYLPVEAILTCAAEETWIRELVNVLPLITEQFCFRFILQRVGARHARRAARLTLEQKYPPPWRRLWREIDSLFESFAVPLAESQLERGRVEQQRFYREKLYEGVELVSGEGPDMEEGAKGTLRGPESNRVAKVRGREVLLRDPNLSRSLALLLWLRTFSHALRVVMRICAPQYNVFTEWMLPYALSSSQCRVDRAVVLMDFTRRVFWGSVSSVIGAVIRSLDDVIRHKILGMLRDELVHELNVKIATADEAFLRRCKTQGICQNGNNTLDRLFEYAEGAASQMLGYFDYTQKKRASIFLGLFIAVLRLEVDAAAFAVLAFFFGYHQISRIIGQWSRGVFDRAVDRELDHMEEESLLAEPHYGLLLMLSVLAEEKEESDETRSPLAGSVQRQKRRGTGPCRRFVPLIACAGTFHFHWPVDFCRVHGENQAKRPQQLRRLQKFFDDVLDKKWGHAPFYTFFTRSRGALAYPLIGSLTEDAACSREFVLRGVIYQALETAASQASSDVTHTNPHAVNRGTRVVLDAEEMNLLGSPQAMGHLPRSLGFDDVFCKPARFIQRQLGLDTVFAYRAVVQAQRNKVRGMKVVLDLLSKPLNNVFSLVLLQLMEFMETVCFYSLLSYRSELSSIWRTFTHWFAATGSAGGSTGSPTEWELASLLDRVSVYRTLLRECEPVELGDPLRLTQQLCRCLPITVHDASPPNYATRFKKKRELWTGHLARREEIQFDDVGRIKGGFRLQKGVQFSGVWFVYPQLHRNPGDGSVHPILSNVTIRFPAGQTTAILGRTGSGKSTLLSLLRRAYDPVPAVVVSEGPDTWVESGALVAILRQCLDAQLPKTGQVKYDNVIMIDDIPLSCFSTTFLRLAIGMLGQDPCAFKNLSFLQNISLFTPRLCRDEAAAVASLCLCEGFIESRPLGYSGTCGELSMGEKQRLALCRAILSGRGGLGVCLLDEPTSHLDGNTAAELEEAISNLIASRWLGGTVLLVSHRLSAIRSAAYVVILGGAKVEYQGPTGDRALLSNSFLRSSAEAQALSTLFYPEISRGGPHRPTEGAC